MVTAQDTTNHFHDELDKGMIYAHRGGAMEYEENSMEGFRGSYEHGLHGLEIDVRMTKDGQFVILHDDSLDRTHNGHGAIEDVNADEIRPVTTKKGQKLLFFDELLTFLADKPGMYLAIEMKTSNKKLYPDSRIEEYCEKIHKLVTANQPVGSHYYFMSFDERPLVTLKRIDPNVNLTYLTEGPCNTEFIQKAQFLGAKRVSINLNNSSRNMVKDAQKAGLKVDAWTIRSIPDYNLAIGLGIDAICCDNPLAIQRYLNTQK